MLKPLFNVSTEIGALRYCIQEQTLFNRGRLRLIMKARRLEIHRKKGPKSTLKSGALSKTCYLDIETTGLNRSEDQISLIGIFHPSKGYVGLVGKFNKRNILKELIGVKRIYTFNGKSFDHP